MGGELAAEIAPGSGDYDMHETVPSDRETLANAGRGEQADYSAAKGSASLWRDFSRLSWWAAWASRARRTSGVLTEPTSALTLRSRW
ncbi:hypothetical protein D3C72_2376130 [compost metagenome]